MAETVSIIPRKAKGFIPDYAVSTVQDIDFAELKKRGVQCMVLDVDHTLVKYNAMVLDEDTKHFLVEQKTKGNIQKIILASNSRRNLQPIADSIGAEVIQPVKYYKPLKRYFRQLQKMLPAAPNEVVMVGDKLLTDILGGNRMGFVTILVNPIGPDRFFDRLIMRRLFGKWYVRTFKKK